MAHLSTGDDDVAGRRPAHNSGLVWGKPPAAAIDQGIQRLIARLYNELRRHPTAGEIEENIYGPTLAPEIVEAMANAARIFRQGVGRDATPFELYAGLVLADARAAMFNYLEREIQPGDRVMWADCDANGQRLHQTLNGRDDMIVPAYGTVTAQPEGWYGENIITRDDGRRVIIGRSRLIKVRS